ncbi:SnoaL-like domain-containing protein [Amycolatopsis xylanica]|uniref:SnoaL-like domain-containing protein n=1 Tax=Amycolatopsis xylanica TaxID=589385 RepID=A0A1H2UUZ0_9PSEU|nr:nuclear transport factor 2 family protein [Amycolatopsis xylanica]SDW59953.1 SnoaL-like domain-containing protein [Amycolatopsis xylanica]
MILSTTTQRFRDAVLSGDHAAIEPLFTPDARMFSPVKFTPFEGRPMILGLLGVLLRTFEGFHYVGEFGGGDSDVLEFRATVKGTQIHGIDLFRFDDQGLINEFTVMVRPLSAVTALSDAVLAGLVADGLVPAPQ